MNKTWILSKECPYSRLSTQWQILRMLSYAVVYGNSSPNGEFQLVSYSQSVISSITGPVEMIFGLVEVAPSSMDKAGWCGRRTAAIQWLQRKFPPLSMFPSPGSIVSQLIEEVMTSIKRSSHSNLRIGGAHSIALFPGPTENSSAFCLLAGGSNTQLKMVFRGNCWQPPCSPILRSCMTSSLLMFMNSQTACLSSLTLSAKGWKSRFLGRLHFSAQLWRHLQ